MVMEKEAFRSIHNANYAIRNRWLTLNVANNGSHATGHQKDKDTKPITMDIIN